MFRHKSIVLSSRSDIKDSSFLPAGAGVRFRVVLLGARRCRRRRLLANPDLRASLGYRQSLAGGLHTRSRPRATKRRRGNPGQRRGGASTLRLAEGPRAGVPRRSDRRSPRTDPISRSISKLSAVPVTQIGPGAAADHQTARAGAHAVWICAATTANRGSVPAAAARSPPSEVVSQRRRVRRRRSGVTEPPPSDPEDLLHVELLPRGRARAATRHSSPRHGEMAGRAVHDTPNRARLSWQPHAR